MCVCVCQCVCVRAPTRARMTHERVCFEGASLLFARVVRFCLHPMLSYLERGGDEERIEISLVRCALNRTERGYRADKVRIRLFYPRPREISDKIRALIDKMDLSCYLDDEEVGGWGWSNSDVRKKI